MQACGKTVWGIKLGVWVHIWGLGYVVMAMIMVAVMTATVMAMISVVVGGSSYVAGMAASMTVGWPGFPSWTRQQGGDANVSFEPRCLSA